MHKVLLGLAVVTSAMATPLSAQAMYKVVGPDGRVTYSDRAPSAPAPAERVEAFRPGHRSAQDPGLPFELRQVAQRFPVVLYTSDDCGPCDSGRQLLLQRGIPFSERKLVTEEDGKAFDKLGAGRTLPGLSVGSRQLRGLNTVDWASYLDAAGYPKESRLPTAWKPPAATPLTTPVDRTASRQATTATPANAAPPTRRNAAPAEPAAVNTANTIRF
jgi:hypothetical protein